MTENTDKSTIVASPTAQGSDTVALTPRGAPEQPTEFTTKEWVIRSGLVDFEESLLSCLALLTVILQKPISKQALKAGLPNADMQFTPDMCVRAADRAGFSASIVHRPSLKKISALTLPCILLLKEQSAVVVLSIDHKKGMAEIAISETGQGSQKIPLADLQKHYMGHAIFMRPKFQFDARAQYDASRYYDNWFWGTLKRFAPLYKHVLLASLLTNLFALATPLFTMNVYDRVVPNAAIETLWVLSSGVIIVYILDLILKNLRSYFVDIAGKNADIIIASRLLEHVMGMRMDKRPESTGSTANSMRDFESLRDFFTSGTLTLLIDLPFLFIFVGIIFMVAGPIGWIPLATIPIVLLLNYVLQIPLKKITDKTMAESSQKHAMLIEALSGLETIKTAGAQSRVQGKWEKLTALTAETSGKAKSISTFATSTTQFLIQMCTILMVMYGVHRMIEKEMTMGAMIASTLLVGRALAPLGQMAGLLLKWQQTRASLEALEKIMNTPIERPVDKTFHHMPQLQGQIEFKEVTFSYPNQDAKALDNVSFTIKPGERVAVLGRIGSGKSTLSRLINGLYEPQEGAVLLDGIDLRQIDPADVRRNIGYVGQDNFLFFGSIRENISYGAPHIDGQAIQMAAHFSGVMDFVRENPKGLDLPVGERGMNLSGGQRQSVAIARAFVGNPPILVMDEPTSNMDNSSESRFQQRLLQYRGLKTLVCITHRSSMLALVDRILVFDGGKLVADGPRDDVLQQLSSGQVKRS